MQHLNGKDAIFGFSVSPDASSDVLEHSVVTLFCPAFRVRCWRKIGLNTTKMTTNNFVFLRRAAARTATTRDGACARASLELRRLLRARALDRAAVWVVSTRATSTMVKTMSYTRSTSCFTLAWTPYEYRSVYFFTPYFVPLYWAKVHRLALLSLWYDMIWYDMIWYDGPY